MPIPNPPSVFRALFTDFSGSLCDKFNALLQMPRRFAENWSYMFDEGGVITPEFRADICSLACIGSGGGGTTQNPNMPTPGQPSASDGSYSDKIRVTWPTVTAPVGITAVSQYQIYRAPITITDPNDAVLVATIPASTDPLLYDDPVDGDLIIGEFYYYWVRASNGLDVSGFSIPDKGNASTVATTLTAVSDLACSKGFGGDANGFVELVWTPTGGASKWDIYRNTVNDAGTAVAIATDQVPASTSVIGPPTTRFFDNDGELLYNDDVPSSTTVYYYWVVGKKDAPPAQSPKSNVDSGWLEAQIAPYGNETVLTRNLEQVIPGGITTVHLVVFGGKAAGGGGGVAYGSGGGGGGAVIIGDLAVVAGGKLRLVSVPDSNDTGFTLGQASGDAGYVVKLQYSANGLYSDTVDVVTTTAPLGGAYSPSGPGVGGAPGGGSTSGLTNVAIIPGRAGGSANAGNGGKSGYVFGQRRLPMSNVGSTFVGSGSKASGNGATVASYVGGTNEVGYAVIAY